jgi:tRNA pseudouridine38-40 synthase
MKTTESVPPGESRWKCTCAFDGRFFKGWQSQVGGGTVQDVVEGALAQLFDRPIRIHGSSRTDSGVHARAMVFHFDGSWKPGPERLEAAVRTLLPDTIRISPIERVNPDFHARFSAVGKRYCYYIYQGWADPFSVHYCWSLPRPLNLEAMEAAAEVLCGRHDFASFAALGGQEMETSIRHVTKLGVRQSGRRVIITAEADGFLYKMVRTLVGAMVMAGRDKITAERIRQILEERHRTGEIVTAPPHGLFLEKVFYRQRPRLGGGGARGGRMRQS